MILPNLLTVETVAERLNVSNNFVYSAIADGRLKHHRLGKKQGGIRVSEAQLAEFLQQTERCAIEQVPAAKLKPRREEFTFLPPPS